MSAAAGPSRPKAPNKSGQAASSSSKSTSADDSLASAGGEGGAGGEGIGGAASDDSDDEVADFRNLLPQLIAQRKDANASGLGHGSLPKRGEKDFEPTGFRGQEKKLEESRRAMQMVIGQERRIGSKSLSLAIWRPELNRAVVDVAKGNTMAALGVTTRAPVTISSAAELPVGTQDVVGPNNQVGVWKNDIFYPRYTSRLELLPEEALYLLERGSLECRLAMPLCDSPTGEQVEVPLSLQHAFSLMLNKDGLTRERYQTYAYLKRLGYYVQRADVAEQLRVKAAEARRKEKERDAACDDGEDGEIKTPKAGTKGIIADPKRPLKLVTLWDLLTYVPRRAAQILFTALAWLKARIARVINALWTSRRGGSAAANSTKPGSGRGLLGIGGAKWDSFDSVYSQLRIIPSGHNSTASTKAQATATPSCSSSSNPFLPFFYAWRPATHFKKTDPPLPEYRIAVIPARSTFLPKLAEFTEMFGAVPLPLEEQGKQDDEAGEGEGDGERQEEEKEERKRALAEKKRNDESYGRGFVQRKKKEEAVAKRDRKKEGSASVEQGGEMQGSSSWLNRLRINIFSRLLGILERLASLFAHLPPGCQQHAAPRTFGGPRGGPGGPRPPFNGPRRPNPFPPLKAGRRNVIVAVVDHGTTSLLRFGEAEFERWKLMG